MSDTALPPTFVQYTQEEWDWALSWARAILGLAPPPSAAPSEEVLSPTLEARASGGDPVAALLSVTPLEPPLIVTPLDSPPDATTVISVAPPPPDEELAP